ncbi:hypothetical protein BDF20DRAFT_820480 [Mycotypha africana]|uniref:uncharacterized protein n=1 Tax=Mycotypha africana TaxID=64632 RepID=UPI0023007931|nr:uncharacterized protein BDF20DRAFT_820480 [Mycotypha africana]KAI8977166.1 hypothetical protein BDF20DRAFT_820480 [Mycotypha africana]
MNLLWNKRKVWKPIEDEVQKNLKKIELLAVGDIQAAYVKSLEFQFKHALSVKEAYFEVYTSILKVLHGDRAILSSSTSKKFTEQDYVIKVWSRIFSAVFDDRSNNMFCVWGDYVPKESSMYKALDADSSNAIGDRIDLRVCHTSPGGEVVDLLCVEFAKDANDDKYFMDHRKVLREAKVNIDRFHRNRYLKPHQKRIISGYCIQISGTEGTISRVRLVDKGLYVANHVGSLRLPSSGADLRKTRTLLERLFTLKDNLLSQREHFDAMEHERIAQKKSLEAKQNKTRSPYENNFNSNSSDSSLRLPYSEKYTSWVRASWFPPSVKKDFTYQGVRSKYLFSPPLPFDTSPSWQH